MKRCKVWHYVLTGLLGAELALGVWVADRLDVYDNTVTVVRTYTNPCNPVPDHPEQLVPIPTRCINQTARGTK